MSSDPRWDRVEALFEAAGDLPEREREAFVRREAAGDAGLVAETLGLLRHAAAAEADWGESAAAFSEPLLADTRQGDRIGAYRLDRQLGRGGMGTVWLAHRTDDLRLRVALKVVRRGLDTADVRHRFRQERRILAALDHPNIARLLDGGVTPDGRPYFVMEYVEGEPIDAYCDRRAPRRRRPARGCSRDVCGAVALRPPAPRRPPRPQAVERPRGRGRRGGARREAARLRHRQGARRRRRPDAGPLTRADQRLLTPAYASPEQLRGEAVTTATRRLRARRAPLRVAHGGTRRARAARRPWSTSTPSARRRPFGGRRPSSGPTARRGRSRRTTSRLRGGPRPGDSAGRSPATSTRSS